ncbi:MAG: peptidoglycan D,D-transpeptidase FtsI family protein [Actinomycetota bacterium]|nr:penicillin-binding protein 2 [Actinomycetota bacterium]
MNRSVRRLAFVLLLAFAALLANLSYVQMARSHALSENPANRRLLVKEYAIQRGQIIAGDQTLAESIATTDNLKYVRRYPLKGLFGFITGYYSVVYGRSALESSFNDYLSGKRPFTFDTNLADELLGRDRKGNSLVLTIDPALQRIAAEKLGDQRGAVAAINPDTGAVLALYSYPTYDPNPLSTHDRSSMREAWERLNKNSSRPLIPRATQERYPPGSTFKPIIAAAALEAGLKPSTRFPNPSSGFHLPDTTRTLKNFGGGACRGGATISLADGLRVSCNSTFAQTALKIGAAAVIGMAEKFGLDRDLGFDVPLVQSCVVANPSGGCAQPVLDKPQTALTGIGQFGVRVTPLEMAIVAATVANGGRVPRPMLVKEVQDFNGAILKTFKPSLSRPIFSRETASTLKQMMINVVKTGTGTNAQIPGVEVGGKTGTAQTGVESEFPHTWFIAFAPHIAVAVIVEHGGDLGNEATGGKVSAPIARALIEYWVRHGGAK